MQEWKKLLWQAKEINKLPKKQVSEVGKKGEAEGVNMILITLFDENLLKMNTEIQNWQQLTKSWSRKEANSM